MEHLATELLDLCASEAELFERLLGTRVEREPHRRWRRPLRDPDRPRHASETRTNPNHPVPELQGSKEPSLMATEARDLMPEAPERINPSRRTSTWAATSTAGTTRPTRPPLRLHDVVEEISAMKGEPEWMRTSAQVAWTTSCAA